MSRRRFVIGLSGVTADQENQFRDYVAREVGSWWHWIDGLWLATTRSGGPKASDIRDKANKIAPGCRCVVFEFPEDITWAATETTGRSGRRMADWLHEPWGKN